MRSPDEEMNLEETDVKEAEAETADSGSVAETSEAEAADTETSGKSDGEQAGEADVAENAGTADTDADENAESASSGDIMEDINLDREERIGAIEALLFCTGSSVEVSKLAESIRATREETEEAISALESRYKSKRSGLELLRLEGSVQLCSKRNYYGVLRALLGTPRRAVLSETVLETLSIVAYKQPVTRIEIENIRGVSCGHQINKLLEYDLIKELGRLDAPGKPLLFGTTEQFLKSFGVSSIDDLPRATPAQIADFQAEAEKEVQEVKV